MQSNYIFITDTISTWRPWWMQSLDSLYDIPIPVVSDLSESMPLVDTISLCTIHGDLQSISDNGIGYSDALGQVAFPLIIALFAFAFTFLFSAINDVNKRYSSKTLSLLFERSFAYRTFMWISGISVLYIVVYAGLSLVENELLTVLLRGCGTIAGVIIAGLYALAVLYFVKKCIDYNKPIKLVGEIQAAYANTKRWIPVRLLYRRCIDWTKGLLHGKGYKEFHHFGYRLSKSGLVHYADEVLLDRLADLTVHALNTNDISLYYTVFDHVDAIIAKEREAVDNRSYRKKTVVEWAECHTYTFRYFERLLNSNNPQWDSQIEESLVWKLLGSFNKSRYLSPIDIFWLFKYLLHLAKCGRYSMINKYIDRSKYSFSFIPRLSEVAFVKGANPEEVKVVENESLENWKELRDYHFLLSAYWFSDGEYKMLTELLHDQSYRSVYLYPVHPVDIIYRYQQCKKRVSEDGRYFDHKTAEDLFGKKIDINAMLDKYTALLLLVCNEGEKVPRQGVKQEEIALIVKAKPVVAKYVNAIKADPEIKRLKQEVNTVDFDKVFDEAVSCLTDFYPKPKPSWCPFTKTQDPFSEPLNNLAKLRLEHLFRNALQHRWSFVKDFWSETTANKNEEKSVGSFVTRVVKDVLINPSDDVHNDFGFASFELDVVESRLMYLFLSFVDASSPKMKKVKNHNLKDCVTNLLENHEEEYVLLDVGGHNSVLLDPRFDNFRHQYFKQKTPYLDMETTRYGHLADLPLYEKYKHSILLIKKCDLPSITQGELQIDYKDISSLKNGNYAVELTIDPQIEIKYSVKSKLICILPER